MYFDDALRVVGEWGKYQKRFYLMVSLPVAFKGFQVMLMVFTAFVPGHRCAVPGLTNDTYHIVDEHHERLVMNSVPSTMENGHRVFDKCLLYADWNSHSSGNSSLFSSWSPGGGMNGSSLNGYNSTAFINRTDSSSNGRARPTTECSRWVYDRSEMDSSLITKFDLVCGQKEFRAHSNMMMMAGFLAGSTIASILCDWIGRKRVYCSCLLIIMAFGVASAYPTSPAMLLAVRFLSGTGLMGIMVTGFVLAVEIISGPMRTTMGAFWQIVWLVGPFVLAGLSYVVRDWQNLQLAGSVPPFVFLIYWWMVSESPRWLVSKGRVDEAMVTLRKVAKVNGKEVPATMADQLKEGNMNSHQDSRVSPLVIFGYPVLILRFFVISFSWAVISMTYYGLSLNVASLSGGIRINFFASCAVELVGYGSATLLLDRFGRKKVHTTSMITAGVACLATIFTVTYLGEDLQWTTTALAMVGKMGVSSSFAVIYLYSAELYPTVLRNFGVGCGSMFARMGSMLSPYIADLTLYVEGDFATAVPLMVFGALAVSAGLTSLTLPETLHRKMPETVQDAVNYGKTSYEDEIAKNEILVESPLDRSSEDDCDDNVASTEKTENLLPASV